MRANSAVVDFCASEYEHVMAGKGLSLRWWQACTFALTWITYASFYFGRRNLSIALPLLTQHYGYTNRQIADLIFGYSLFYAIGQFCCGSLSDRFGSKKVIAIGMAGIAAANFLMGFRTSFVALAVLACLNGAAQSTGWPSLTRIMASWFPSTARGSVMGWWSTNYVLGSFAATLFATFLATSPGLLPGLAWRRAFWGPALVVIAVGVAFVFFVRPQPSDAGLRVDERGGAQMPGAKPNVTVAQKSQESDVSVRSLLTDGAIWVAASAYFLVKLIRYAFLFWLPLYMTQQLHYGATAAGYTSALYELVGLAGAIFAGFASDRYFQSRRFPVAALMLWALALLSLAHPRVALHGHAFNAIGIALIGAATYGPDTLIVGATAQDLGRGKHAGTVAGIIDGIGSLGQLCSPFVVALVSRRFGWDALFYLFVAFAAIAGLLLVPKWKYRAALLPS